MLLTLLILNACTAPDKDQAQVAQHNPLSVPPVISELLAVNTGPTSRELDHFLKPQGSRLASSQIPITEKQKAITVIEQIFKSDRTPETASLNWSAIGNDGNLNEHLITQWSMNQTRVKWSDVDQSIAVLSVTFLDILLPVDQPEVFVDVVSDWIVDNFRMPNPLPAKMKLFQTSMIDGIEPAISGSIAFPDAVNRELSNSSFPTNKRWCQHFGFAATRKTLVLLIHTNWITTESPHRPSPKYRDGRRISRFDPGG